MRLKARGDFGWFEIVGVEFSRADVNRYASQMREKGVMVMKAGEELAEKWQITKKQFLQMLSR